MKKIVCILISLTIFNFIYTQEKKDIEIYMYSINKNNEVQYGVYERDYPKTYEESLELINSLVSIINTMNKDYVNIIKKDKNTLFDLEHELTILKKQKTELEITLKDKDKTIKELLLLKDKKAFYKQLSSLGIIGEYGFLGDSNELSVQFGMKIWNFTLCVGPNICVPRDLKIRNPQYGFRASLGYWF